MLSLAYAAYMQLVTAEESVIKKTDVTRRILYKPMRRLHTD